jgi:hypothetical protein
MPVAKNVHGTRAQNAKTGYSESPDGTWRGQGQRLPDTVRAGGEDGEAAGPVAVELRREEALEPLEVAAHAVALVRVEVRAQPLGAFGQEGADARGHVAGGRRAARVEIEIEADGATALGPEPGQLAQRVE